MRANRLYAALLIAVSVFTGMQLATGQTSPGGFGNAPARMNPQVPADASTPMFQGTDAGSRATTVTPSEVEAFLPLAQRATEPRVVIKTSLGDIHVKLYSTHVPRTVRSFLELVKGERDFTDVKTSKRARRAFYGNNMIFHRVVPGYLIQTGCPFGNGRGDPGFKIDDEFNTALKFNKPGIIAMAPEREGSGFKANSNGSQFFITLAPLPEWDGKFTIFGEVESGLDVVQQIGNAKTGPTDRPIRRIYLNSIEEIQVAPSGPAPASVETPTATAPGAPVQ